MRWIRGRERERGAISLWAVTAAFAMIILAGLAVDLGGKVQAQQHAIDVATQAARAGGQQLDAARAVRGYGAQIDPTLAVAAARAYLAASDLTGTVTTRGGSTVVVTTSGSYSTKFLGIIGISSLPVTGSAESRTVRVYQGTER